MLKVVFLLQAVSWCFAGDGGLDLPSYISKCSLSDPKLSKCLIEKANEVIPIIAKGDASYNIPPISPITYAEATFESPDLTYVIYNARIDDWKKFIITDMFMDLEKGEISFVAVVDKIEIIAQNYTIPKGKIFDIPVQGHGKLNSTFMGGKLKYNARLRLYKKGEDVYLDQFDSRVDSTCERAYFYFENLQSTEKHDLNEYIDENWEKIFALSKPAYDNYCKAFVHYPLESILRAVPFNRIFLP